MRYSDRDVVGSFVFKEAFGIDYWIIKPKEMKSMRTFEIGATRDNDNHSREYHGHPRFYELLQQMADLHSRKNHDYAGDDPLSNLRASEEIDIPAWKGILIRLMDKWGRLKTFAKTGSFEVKDESVNDTLMDNAVYSLLCIIVLEEAKAKETPQDKLEEQVQDFSEQKTPKYVKTPADYFDVCAACKHSPRDCPKSSELLQDPCLGFETFPPFAITPKKETTS